MSTNHSNCIYYFCEEEEEQNNKTKEIQKKTTNNFEKKREKEFERNWTLVRTVFLEGATREEIIIIIIVMSTASIVKIVLCGACAFRIIRPVISRESPRL